MDHFDDRPAVPEQPEVEEFFSFAQQLAHPPDAIKVEQMRQARFTFNLALVLCVIGTLILLAGVATLLFGKLQTDKAGLTVASGLITDALSFFAIKFHRETNNRLDEIRRDEHMFKLIGQIVEPAIKDQAISTLVKTFRPRALGK